MDAYLTDAAVFLPNAPVPNAGMEAILGRVNGLPSRTRELILRSNRITTRYYAIDPTTGRQTHSNAQLTAGAVRALGLAPEDLTCLACGTSSPDQLMPGHASMVHGELGGGPIEIASFSGICAAGMGAFKHAAMNVALGFHEQAVATGSELASSFLRGEFCATPEQAHAIEQDLSLQFDADFLRWMLSDGAGAALIARRPAAERLSLKIEWIEAASFAHELPPCMYAGATRDESGHLTGWREMPPREAAEVGSMLIKQDVKLLNRQIPLIAIDRTLAPLAARRNLRAEAVDWFLPHYSSGYFRPILLERLRAIGLPIPEERWYTNLDQVGNIGSAAIYAMLAGLLADPRLRPGQQVLCFVPERGRFLMYYTLLTVVEA